MDLSDRYIPEPNSGCWLWLGSTDEKGYALMRHRKPLGGWTTGRVHRLSYEAVYGAIPVGLVLDHKCRVRCCINPAHLEPVTNAENIRRGLAGINSASKTHCPQGHPYSGLDHKGARICRKCQRESVRRYRSRRKNHV
jgi:hypothetical protein